MGTGTAPARSTPAKVTKYARLVGNMMATVSPGMTSRSSNPAAMLAASRCSAA